MPQTKIYKSAKARQKANRERSKRHYQLNKEAINSRRRTQYQEKKGEVSRKPNESEGLASQGQLRLESERNPIDIWLERASRIHSRFLKSLEGNGVQFLHKACREYLEEANGDSILDRENMLQGYRLSILQCHDNVLQLSGIGKELEKIESMVQDIKRIIDWLDEVEMAALEDFDELRKLYHKGAFDFQKQG